MNKHLKTELFMISSVVVLLATLFLVGCAHAGTPVYFIVQGNLYATRYAESGKSMTFPEDPQVTGMTFNGWIDAAGEAFHEDAYVSSPCPTASVTVYADFTSVSYALTYLLDGGTLPAEAPESYVYSTLSQALPRPTREGMTFAGWLLSGKTVAAIPAKTTGALTLTATWTIATYVLHFDTRGGSTIADITASAGEAISAPEDPTKDDNTFTGWFTDVEATVPYLFSVMPAQDLTIHAGWSSSLNHALHYSADDLRAVITGNKYDGESVTKGERVILSAPATLEGKVFKGWYVSTVLVSKTPTWGFSMPGKDYAVQACYEAITSASYDRESGEDLVIPGTSLTSITRLEGAGLTSADYTTSGTDVTIPAKVARTLPLGETVFELIGEASLFVQVTVTSSLVPADIRVDYDSAYPEVMLTFTSSDDCLISLNGASYVPASTGMILNGYDKSLDNLIRLKAAGSTEAVTVVRPAWTSSSKTYYTKSFVYEGRTQDYVLESTAELATFIHYVVFVAGVLNKKTSTDAPYGEHEEYGYVETSIQVADTTALFNPLLSSYSAPMNVLYAYSGGTTAHPVVKLHVTYQSTLNTERTAQELKVQSDDQGLLSSATRASDFTAFKINDWTRTQEIRTLYELEDLPYGVKPVIASGTLAAEVYAEAEKILRTIIDDRMTDQEKVTAIYDWLGLNVTYDTIASEETNPGAYRAYTTAGALLDRQAVCDGIASAFTLLASIEGIESTEVVGLFNGGGHAWNKVRLDGVWWGVDATWSRAGNHVTHAFLFMNESALVATGHQENGSANAPFVTNVASGTGDWYDMQIMDDEGHSRRVESTAAMRAALLAASSQGIKTLEVVSSLGGQFETDLRLASLSSHVTYESYESFNVSGVAGRIYFINL